MGLQSVFLDRRFLLGTPLRVTLLLLMVNVAIGMRRASLVRARAANLLAPVSTVSGALPRYDISLGENLDRYLTYIPDARAHRLVVLSGMSQLYSINQGKPGDETTAEHMDDALRGSGTRVFGLAAPNLNNEEALLLLLTTASNPRTKPAVFIYAICLDKMRLMDIRPAYLAFLRRHPDVQVALAKAAADYASVYPIAAQKLKTDLASLNANSAESDKSFEHRLREQVGHIVPVVGERTDLNNFVMYDVLYTARNKLFGITNTSRRPLVPLRYELNKQFLLMVIDIAQRQGIRFAGYVVPLNPQAENPYVPSEYAAFKQWYRHVADSTKTAAADLEGIVPREDWGLVNGGPDFKHFKEAGHRITAEALVREFGTVLGPTTSDSARAR